MLGCAYNYLFFMIILWGLAREVPERSEGDGVNVEYIYGRENIYLPAPLIK